MDLDEWPKDHKILDHVSKAELQRRGFLEYPPAKPSTLSNAIHLLFAPKAWDNVSNTGYDSMIPALRLATRFISDPQLLHYWHALLHGPREIVQEWREVKGSLHAKKNFAFHPNRDPFTRLPFLTSEMMKRVHLSFHRLSRTTRFQFSFDCNRKPSLTRRVTTRPPPLPELSHFGKASDVLIHGGHLVALADQSCSTSRKLRIQFIFAVSLVHAVAHVCNDAVQHEANFKWEPYFENDSQAETGFAWAKILNGFPHCTVDFDFANKYGIIWRRFPWRERHRERHHGYRLQDEPRYTSDWTTHWFTPTQYVADLASEDFWGINGIARYGPELLKQPRMFGLRQYFEPSGQFTRHRPLSSSDFEPKRGYNFDGLGSRVIDIRERSLVENWDLHGDAVMSDILATLKVDRRVKDATGDTVMRDRSHSPKQSFPWPRTLRAIMGSRQGTDEVEEWLAYHRLHRN
ncbi:hypothetical protein MMC07_009904 [Pseudocyphellaria aurata]|nr:hypothetical protein [Pseudocyphellaria aurata]